MDAIECRYPGCGTVPRTGVYCYEHRFVGNRFDGVSGGEYQRLTLPDVRRLAETDAAGMSAVLLRSKALIDNRPRMRLRDDGSLLLSSASVRGYVFLQAGDANTGEWVTTPHVSDRYALTSDGDGDVVLRYHAPQTALDVDLIGWRACRQAYRHTATQQGAAGAVLFEEYEGRHEAIVQLDLGHRVGGDLAVMPSTTPGLEDMYRFRSFDASVEFSGAISFPTDHVAGNGEVVPLVQVLEKPVQMRDGSAAPHHGHYAMLFALQGALTSIMQLQVPDPPNGGTMLPVGWATHEPSS